MNTRLVALLLVCLLSIVPTVFAQSKTTDDRMVKTETLIDQCRDEMRADEKDSASAEVMANGIVCLGYIRGFWDAASPQLALAASDTQNLCVPAEISLGQLARIYVKYMDDHPEKMDLPAAGSLLQAIMTAFPCQKPSGHDTKQPGPSNGNGGTHSAIRSTSGPRPDSKIAFS